MPLSYFPETMPQARGDQVMAPTPERVQERVGEVMPVLRGVRRGCVQGRTVPTYLVEQLWQLDLYLLPLEHVVFRLLADGRDQVELPSHRVGLLWCRSCHQQT